MNRFVPLLTLASLPLLLGALAMPRSAMAQSACCHTCPRCDTCCQLKAEPVDEEKECWRVKCEQICVPRVVFPWQQRSCDPCANNGVWVKTIKVLESHSYTCPSCEYTWAPAASNGACGGAADCTGGAIVTDDHGGAAAPAVDWKSIGPAPHPGPVALPATDRAPAPPSSLDSPTYDNYFGMINDSTAAPSVAPLPGASRPRALIRKVSDLFLSPDDAQAPSAAGGNR